MTFQPGWTENYFDHIGSRFYGAKQSTCLCHCEYLTTCNLVGSKLRSSGPKYVLQWEYVGGGRMQWGKGLRPGGPYHPLLFVGKTFILFWYELHIKSKWERKMKRKKSSFPRIIPSPTSRFFLNFLWKKGRDGPDVPYKLAPSPFPK